MGMLWKWMVVVAKLAPGPAAVGQGVGLSSGRVPVQSTRPREHARPNTDRALPQFGDRYPYPRRQSLRDDPPDHADSRKASRLNRHRLASGRPEPRAGAS